MQLIRYDFSKIKGLDNTSNPSYLGENWLSSSINMIHSAAFPCTMRSGISRILYNSPDPNQQIMGMYEHFYFDGTRVNLLHMFDDLYSFDIDSPLDAPTLIRANIFATNFLTAYTSWLNNYIITDQRHHNYIGNQDGVFPLQIDAPTTTFTATATAGAGLEVGSYYYSYSRYSSSTGEYSPPSYPPVSVTTTAPNSRVTLNAASISFTEQFDMIQLYRTAVGADQMFELAKITPTQFDSGYLDSIPDSDLVTISPVHDIDSTASITDKPEPAFDCEVHKSRLWLANFESSPNKVRWSQLNATQFESTTDAYIELPDDGDEVVRLISQTASMVVMKRNSIWVINGDVDQTNFTLQVMSPKEVGVGAYAPWTAVETPIGIIFLSSCGIWKYTNGSNITDIGIPVRATINSLDYTQKDKFVGGYDPCLKAYMLSASTGGGGTDTPSNNITLVYFIETGAWSIWDFGNQTTPEGAGFPSFYPSYYAQFTVGQRVRLLMGGDGYPYLLNQENYVDGAENGTFSGDTTTGTTDDIVVDSSASFYAPQMAQFDALVAGAGADHYYKMDETGTGLTMEDSIGTSNGDYTAEVDLGFGSGPFPFLTSRQSVKTNTTLVAGGIAGYFAGGATGNLGGTIVATADKLVYTTNTTASQASANLSTNRAFVASAQSATNGYFAGGLGVTAITDKLVFATDTTSAAATANLSGARQGATGVSSSTNGYFCGGNNGGYITTADKLVFGTDTTSAQASANLSQARAYAAGCQSSTNGYIVSGFNGAAVTTADKLLFSTDTTSAQVSANLSAAKFYVAGASSSLAGYFAGGGNFTVTTATDKMPFSTETTALLASAVLSQTRVGAAGVNASASAYFGGGGNGFATTYAVTDKLVFSTDLIAASVASNLSQARQFLIGCNSTGIIGVTGNMNVHAFTFQSYAVEFWVKTTDNQSDSTIWAASDNSVGIALLNPASLTLQKTDGSESHTIGTNIADGDWHHIVLRNSGSGTSTFVDGQLVDAHTWATSIGAYSGPGWMGGWDESPNVSSMEFSSTAVYLTTLPSNEEINLHYYAGLYSMAYYNMPVLLQADGTAEYDNFQRTILYNTEDTLILTNADASVGTEPAIGENYFIGAYLGNIETGRFTCGTTLQKRFNRISIEYETQGHQIPIEVTYAIDYRSTSTQKFFIQNKGTATMLAPSGDGVGMRLFIRSIGCQHPFTIIAVEIEYAIKPGTRTPGNAAR